MPAAARHTKIALITGAARRIGRGIALDLAAAGWAIAVHYRSSSADAEALAAEIRVQGGVAAALSCDLADAAALPGLIDACCDRIGTPTCLINNASEFLDDTPMTLTAERFQTHIDVNLRAPLLLAQAFAKALAESQSGVIINIIDQRVLRPTPEFFSYAVSKAALWSATRMLAQGLAPRVRVNAIAPGPVLASVHQSAADFEIECTSTPLVRGTSPNEIAAAVRFILDAPAMTGQMITLDGGQHLSWTPERRSTDPSR
jgi:NAD(P)-dependent dehydrogenase (short-subunit alcohol dehydrogenase family)